MTISQALNEYAAALKASAAIENPHLEAELLLSHIMKKPRAWLLAHGEKKLTKLRITNYELQIQKRKKHTPLAYLTGHKEFYGLDFRVNRHVLIPRPETELMVDEALEHIATHGNGNMTIADIGTGSGCIIIALAKSLKNFKFQISNFKFFALDISPAAIAVARRNARQHGVNKHIEFMHGNLLEPLIRRPSFVIRHSSFVILSNLPYLTPAQIKNSPTIKHEPRLALSAGPDGLKYYHRLFLQIRKSLIVKCQLSTVNCQLSIVCEIDPSQTKKMKKLVKTVLPQAEMRIKKDLSGHDRLVILTIDS